MADADVKLKKLFEAMNKNLYKSNKVLEQYAPIYEIYNGICMDVKEIADLLKKNPQLEKETEDEIKRRELISLHKKMTTVVANIKTEVDTLYKEMVNDSKFLEQYRNYRTYIFPDSKKTQDFLKKTFDGFNIESFVLKFNVVGNINLAEITEKVKGKKNGIDIIVPAENLNLVFEEVLKSQTSKFRLVTEPITIYIEKETVLYIEGQSKKVQLCDIDAQNFGANILDN